MKFLRKYFEIANMIPWIMMLMILAMCAGYMFTPDSGFLIWEWMFIVLGYMVGYKRVKNV
ncbi:hypothetical protein MYO4S_00220 [Serratia phage 4S]|nr:hypothetical protein MYO4S_00220 [Serratia phage 4S]